MVEKDHKMIKEFGSNLIAQCGVEKLAIVSAGTIASGLIGFVFLMAIIPNNFINNKGE